MLGAGLSFELLNACRHSKATTGRSRSAFQGLTVAEMASAWIWLLWQPGELSSTE